MGRHLWHKIDYNGKESKLEIFDKNHHLYKSLPLHERALKAGIRLPKIYKIEHKNNFIYKYNEWIEGETLRCVFKRYNPCSVDPICKGLAKYINKMYDLDGMLVRDNKFENFIWHNDEVVCIDLKFLMYEKHNYLIDGVAKMCLYDFEANRERVIVFLKEYSKYREVQPILDACEIKNWKWFKQIKPITMGDIK